MLLNMLQGTGKPLATENSLGPKGQICSRLSRASKELQFESLSSDSSAHRLIFGLLLCAWHRKKNSIYVVIIKS